MGSGTRSFSKIYSDHESDNTKYTTKSHASENIHIICLTNHEEKDINGRCRILADMMNMATLHNWLLKEGFLYDSNMRREEIKALCLGSFYF